MYLVYLLIVWLFYYHYFRFQSFHLFGEILIFECTFYMLFQLKILKLRTTETTRVFFLNVKVAVLVMSNLDRSLFCSEFLTHIIALLYVAKITMIKYPIH